MGDINEILGKHFSGETTPQEELEVKAWIAENEDEYTLLKEAWGAPIVTIRNYNQQAAWFKVEPQLENKTGGASLGRFLKFAAAACAATLIGWFAYWYFSAEEYLRFINNTETAMEFDLPDGSTVWLSPASELEYASNFSDHRNLILHGEGFFNVTRDEAHPFIIQAGTGEVEVLGTSFNVNVTESSTSVSVESGKVAVRNDHDEVQLTMGQTVIVTEDQMGAVTIADPNFKSWQSGEFIFEDTPLPEVVILLNQYYPEEIILQSEKAKASSITAQFKNQKLEEIIEIIVLTCDLESISEGNQLYLK